MNENQSLRQDRPPHVDEYVKSEYPEQLKVHALYVVDAIRQHVEELMTTTVTSVNPQDVQLPSDASINADFDKAPIELTKADLQGQKIPVANIRNVTDLALLQQAW